MATFATIAKSALPRQMEITREFEVLDPDESDSKVLRDRIANADLEIDLRNVLGRGMDQLAFAEVTWARFREFVQKVGRPVELETNPMVAPVEKTELTSRLRLRGR